jgi:hypothetical protein
MHSLTIVYDPSRVDPATVSWIARQPKHVPIELLAADEGIGSVDPLLRPSPYRDGGSSVAVVDGLVAVDDVGGVYGADSAWLVILWALRGYRRWSYRLARPGERGRPGRFIGWVSRHRLGRLWLELGVAGWR